MRLQSAVFGSMSFFSFLRSKKNRVSDERLDVPCNSPDEHVWGALFLSITDVDLLTFDAPLQYGILNRNETRRITLLVWWITFLHH